MATLKKYKEKRNFGQTREPKAKIQSARSTQLRFVVQRHAATRLHYDFRLEMEGVLKSWAVPKGPSMNPADKRLAMMVEDHPYDYRTFEGTIPEGNYGAGEVEIWDEGTYEALQKESRKKEETVLLEELKNGSLKFILHGKKLKGEFALVRMKTAQDSNAWLLIKHRDAFATSEKYDAEALTAKTSRVTKAVENKKTEKKNPGKKIRINNTVPDLSGTRKYTRYIKPMLASLKKDNQPFSDKDWVFEIKWDGYRAIAELTDHFRLYSRNGLNFEKRYAPVAEALKKQQHEMILDGEIVAYNDKGMPNFQALQLYQEQPGTPLVYQVFDLLYLNGHSTELLTLLERKELLKKALKQNDIIKYCDHVVQDGTRFFKELVKADLEGMIAKKADSTYTEGRRSTEWLKIKYHNIEEVVIAGYTAPRGSRSKFGALILGRYKEGRLLYAGHTGTGFNEVSLQELFKKMQPLVISKSPFAIAPKTNMPATWLRPKLVGVIKYSELTKDGIFRHPVFEGLREDKPAKEVVITPNTINMPASKTTPEKQESKPRTAPAAKGNAQDQTVKLNGHEVKLTHQQKIYWPEEGYTKGDLIGYYNNIYRFILPYLKSRPESMNRFPNGIAGESFYQKDIGASVPDWLHTVPVFSESNQKEIHYVVCNDRASLLYLANLGCIEFNPWNSTVQKLDFPTYMIIDIDPSEKNNFDQVIDTALAAKQVLDECGAVSYCKTSGASGMHVHVPLNNQYSYDQVKDFAHLIAIKITELLPDSTTLERNLKKRGNRKIYVDYLQNRKGQTIASAYSVRPKPGATVSTPLHWKEVKKGLHPAQFTMQTLPKRLEKLGDLFKPVLGKGINMLKCIEQIR
ncbi:DNA ligase D [Niabella ginsenosidivorans]|uniref:DNA ligase (ATP) n=1 Tax=Niabella ginsenosidivorans TaxID=1176587 RepID=A0A1A9I261_9BACT|nr:DNA ligase D [Niabella ginsenosidivorans]ANH81613.1 DNA ligase D [Niabella ginsenosidivorans]